MEFRPLERLREVISDHVACWAILYINITFLGIICDEKIAYFHVSCIFARRPFSIFFQQDRALIVLEYYVVNYGVSLRLHEVSGP